ncbi:exonuclease domain-containing protein [Mucilaginibacter myungsuensis]|uniref:GIY-YIG nuclease family protein n=1 Tax=Mucilaginibacter myungsuensis TaxID=649104 RepID=A0A929PZC5_9SPHI|nr:exonuclease domain-containing protein [Mucilaginibacter myungsuensis]MBE9664355.1 GIY-YIG nuclease family protein [Mucilaginibacter myungsuensis]MDN3597065.1 exonuclease domain-containing protein [Mucilaginibacter myungsuensis]
MYAIVDIETTGGHASANGITEVAIRIHDGMQVTHRYETLINPLRDIPVFIRALTGITNEMVDDAPTFNQVAHEIYQLLHDKIFVAHNVNFDYSFLRYHLSAAGYDLNCNKLCTVRLGRKILPGLPSYSLGKLCHHLGIGNTSRHRAGGDAEATAELFGLLLRSDSNKHILASLKKNSKEQNLPANLPKGMIDSLPMMPGVYYFHDQKGKVIYVGKAVNIKKRVCSHFSGNNPNLQRQEFLKNIYHITHRECGTELMSLALEAIEIKRLWPKYNRSLKRFEHTFGLYTYEDQRGYLRLAVDKNRKHAHPVHNCRSLLEGYSMLNLLMEEFGLCPKLCFIQKNNEVCGSPSGELCACTGHEEVDVYNHKVNTAIESLKEQLPTFAIRDKGRNWEEQSCMLIENGRFYGMGYIPNDFEVNNFDALKACLAPHPDNGYIRNLVVAFAERYPARKVEFELVEAFS